MAKGDHLGEFELVVLLGLARLDDEAYGMTVFEEIERVTGRDLTIPAVYVTLSRLRGDYPTTPSSPIGLSPQSNCS